MMGSPVGGPRSAILAAAWVAAVTSPLSVDRLAWLTGCWEAAGDTRTSREHWMAPDGGTMIGMNRTVAGGRTVATEFLRIEEREDGIFFVAAPSGQTGAEFRLTAQDDSSATFENPEHDFPQRIAYRQMADGSLHAEISGETGDGVRTVPFPMQRVSCE